MPDLLRIAFVACNKNAARFAEDASFIYRCANMAHALKVQGHTVWMGHVSKLPWRGRWDVVVFHRPRAGWRLTALVTWLRRERARTVADVDDLVFYPNLARYSPGVANNLVSLKTTVQQFSAHQRALASVDRITVSTPPLIAYALAHFKQAKVAVIPNAVHWSWREFPAYKKPERPGRLIGYFPGTRSHDRDFAQVAPVLQSVLAQCPDVRLSVTGPLDFELDARPGQVERHDKMPFDRFHENVQRCDVNLAPLEASPFTACKSALKVIEAGYWNIPTVCSPLPDAQRFVGAGACMANTPAEFEAQLLRLLRDDAWYAEQTDGLRERVLALADVNAVAQQWLDFVTEDGPHRG
jgi:glycosyltransferase involved in cell wall biosynthesis